MALHYDVLGPKGITIWGMVEMDMDGDKLQRLKNIINMALPKTVQVVRPLAEVSLGCAKHLFQIIKLAHAAKPTFWNGCDPDWQEKLLLWLRRSWECAQTAVKDAELLQQFFSIGSFKPGEFYTEYEWAVKMGLHEYDDCSIKSMKAVMLLLPNAIEPNKKQTNRCSSTPPLQT